MSDLASTLRESSPLRFFGRFTHEQAASCVFFLFLWYFWGVRYSGFLYVAQENSIFLYTREYLTRWLETPDGGLCYLSSFLMQFFYYPLLGGGVFALLGTLGQLLLGRVLGLRGCGWLLSFIPVSLFTVSTTWNGIYIFIPYNIATAFSAYAGFCISLLILSLYVRFEGGEGKRPILGVVFLLIAYPFCSAWASWGGLFCAAWALGRLLASGKDKKSRRTYWLEVLVLTVASIVVPLVYYYACYDVKMRFSNIYLQGFWEEARYDTGAFVGRLYYTLSATSIVFTLAALLLRGFLSRLSERTAKRREIREKESQKSKKEKNAHLSNASEDAEQKRRNKERARVRLMWELLFVLAACVYFGSYHVQSFFSLMECARAVYNEDWEKVLRLEARDAYPIDGTVQMRNVALFKTGRLMDDAFRRPLGGLSAVRITGDDYARSLQGNAYYKMKVKLYNWSREMELDSNRALCERLYCYWGQTNVATRIAMNNWVATDERSTAFMKTLAIAALANGEDRIARRFLEPLTQTLFHRRWAKVRLAYLKSPTFYDGVRDFHNDPRVDEIIEARRETREEAASLEEAAARYGVDKSEVEKVAETISAMREMRPSKNYATATGYPNLVFLYALAKEDEYDSSCSERRNLILLSLLMQKKGDEFLTLAEPLFKEKYHDGDAPRTLEQGYATWRYRKYGSHWDKCDYKFSDETKTLLGEFIDYMSRVGSAARISDPDVQETIRVYCQGLYWGFVTDESVYNHY